MGKLIKMLALSLNGLLLGSLVLANSDKVELTNLHIDSTLVVGDTIEVSLDLLALKDINPSLITVGLKPVNTELSLAQNKAYFQHNKPDIVIGVIEQKSLTQGMLVQINTALQVLSHIPEGDYLVAILINEQYSKVHTQELTPSTLLGDDFVQVIKPDLPNLIIDQIEMTGSYGYVLSKDPNVNTLRLNITLRAQSQPIYDNIDARFSLHIPTLGQLELQPVHPTNLSPIPNQWILTKACDHCAVIEENQTVSQSLVLHYDASQVRKTHFTGPVKLKISIDPSQRIEQWQNQHDDNETTLYMYLLDN